MSYSCFGAWLPVCSVLNAPEIEVHHICPGGLQTAGAGRSWYTPDLLISSAGVTETWRTRIWWNPAVTDTNLHVCCVLVTVGVSLCFCAEIVDRQWRCWQIWTFSIIVFICLWGFLAVGSECVICSCMIITAFPRLPAALRLIIPESVCVCVCVCERCHISLTEITAKWSVKLIIGTGEKSWLFSSAGDTLLVVWVSIRSLSSCFWSAEMVIDQLQRSLKTTHNSSLFDDV